MATVTAALDKAASAATTLTVSAAAVAPASSSDFSLSSANTLTFATGSTASTGTVTLTAVDNAAGRAGQDRHGLGNGERRREGAARRDADRHGRTKVG